MTKTTDLRLMLNQIEVIAAKLNRDLAATRAAMQAEQPDALAAARYDANRVGPRTEMWCSRHECPVRQCHGAGVLCDGQSIEIHDGIAEAAADMADGRDPATRALRDHEHAIRQALDHLAKAQDVGGRYLAPPPPPKDDSCPEDWCVSCYRDDHHHEPVDAKRYKRLCSWCGRFQAEQGCQPPLELVQARHRPPYRVTVAQVEQALAGIGRRTRQAS